MARKLRITKNFIAVKGKPARPVIYGEFLAKVLAIVPIIAAFWAILNLYGRAQKNNANTERPMNRNMAAGGMKELEQNSRPTSVYKKNFFAAKNANISSTP